MAAAMAEEDEQEEADSIVAECAVCLQPYDEDLIIPRVLPCGHTLCDPCISTLSHDHRNHLHHQSSSFIRCPECNQPSKIVPSLFPKNIELLRLIIAINRHRSGSSQKRRSVLRPSHHHHRSDRIRRPSPIYDVSSSSSELLKWILPETSARICRYPTEGQVFFLSGFNERLQSCPALFVNMQKLWPRLKVNGNGSEVDYLQKVKSSLDSLSKYDVRDLLHLLMLQEGVFGFWMDAESCLFLVCESLTVFDSKQLLYVPNGDVTEFRISNSFVARCMEICEIFMDLHDKHVIAGLITPQCLCSTEFLHIKLNISAILNVRETLRHFSDVNFTKLSSESVGDDSALSVTTEFPLYYSSPEFLEGLRELNAFWEENMTCKTDSWTLGCLLCYVLMGATPWDDLQIDDFINKRKNHKQHADSWIQKRINMDGDSFLLHFLRLLLRCFSPDPEERPCVSELWQHLLCIQTSSISSFASKFNQGSNNCCGDVGIGYSYCLVLGCNLTKETIETVVVIDSNYQTSEASSIALEKLSNSDKCPTREVHEDITLEGHLDQVTCLAIRGKYLLSASFDKTICVWSLDDAILLKTLKGHSQMVMALVIDQHMAFCISGDYGGELCVWDVESGETSFLVKWHHHQDWRYSGIASLALSSDFLYSGGGDKNIKVWSLKDYELITTMEGHTSVVSALLVDDGLLYSGSWDGTIRLWLRSDHSPLAVLSDISESGPVRALEISGGLLLAGYQNGGIQVWKDEICMNTIITHSGVISSLCISGDTLYSGSWDGTIKACKLDELLDDATIQTVRNYDTTVTSMTSNNNVIVVGLSTKMIHIITSHA